MAWLNDNVHGLLRHLDEEVRELKQAIHQPPGGVTTKQHVSSIMLEAADVANMAMMIADWYQARLVDGDEVRRNSGTQFVS